VSSRWTDLTGGAGSNGDEYAARFDRLAESGTDVHGEARLCDSLLGAPGRVLDAGCGTGRVAIRLAELGHDCTGVDADESMLDVARARAPGLSWVLADLFTLDVDALGREGFDLVVAAGNVIPLLAAGTEALVVSRLAALLNPGAWLVAGFGLDPEHLPLDDAPVDLASYDQWCTDAGLAAVDRFATWDGDPYVGGGYAVSVHRRSVPADG
jgi:SAM-dependent methyltransferase